MDTNNLKKACAKEALKYIKNNTVIGLGGGRTIAHMINYIIEDKNLNVKIVTPSIQTKMLCIEKGLEVLHTCAVDRISVAFDGCDEVDLNLNALKSGGGIHTTEKLIANIADQYILLVDEDKVSDSLTFKKPVVLEILRDSLKYVERVVRKLGGIPKIRKSSVKDGFTVSDNGNFLIDVTFENVTDIKKLEKNLKDISGVIDTSLFVGVVSRVLVASTNGIRIIKKN
ncbi:ribose 5-phosphate isomerase A [Clostridium sp.]|jgi:ribose 5-phosphate isomerase A|uniref:ribose 5-phosphate isomerase A n=1 Tax=Clostridium sp. TaxID=1506 RepID=UPI003A412119